MGGRHLADARDRDEAVEYPAGIPNGGTSNHGRRQRLAEATERAEVRASEQPVPHRE